MKYIHESINPVEAKKCLECPQRFDEHFLLFEHLGLHLVESGLINKLENIFSHQLVKRLTFSDESDEVLLNLPLYPLAVSLTFLGGRERPERVLIDLLPESLKLANLLLPFRLLIYLPHEFQVLFVVDQQFFEDEEETVVVKALEGRGARDHFGHKVVVLKFDSLGGLRADAVHVQYLDEPPVSCVVLGDRDSLQVFIQGLRLIVF